MDRMSFTEGRVVMPSGVEEEETRFAVGPVLIPSRETGRTTR